MPEMNIDEMRRLVWLAYDGLLDDRLRMWSAVYPRLGELLDRLEQAEAENARLREALEAYADFSNWIPFEGLPDGCISGLPLHKDAWDDGHGWAIARAALASNVTEAEQWHE